MMNTAKSVLLAAMFVLNVGAMISAADEIKLRARVELNSPVVRLSDLAEIVTVDRNRQRELAAVVLMPAPSPGTRRFLQQREIADLLSARGIDLGSVRFAGADQVEIAFDGDGWQQQGESAGASAPVAPKNRHAAILAGRAGESISPSLDTDQADELRDQINQLIVSYLDAKFGQAATWHVTCDVADRHLAQLETATSTPVCEGGSPPWIGRQRFVVSFRTREGEVQLPIYAKVTAISTPVVVAVRPIGRGEPITASALELRAVDYLPQANARRNAVDSIDELIGMEARQAIRAGDVVFSDQVRAPIVVKRGEVITVSSQAGGIRVRTTARAREDGARGDLVQVESLETRERFEARVVGPRQAAVFALTRPTSTEPAEPINTARRTLR